MTTEMTPITTLDAEDLAEFERTLRAMLEERVAPLCDDDLSLARHQAHERSLEEALERISAGTFGGCQGCGGPIPSERLEVVPTAQRCRTCASRPS
ncbi:TraR/DksA family transcriptional regulator [Aquihabitans sp. McL0605]|uniref:TraR/DksA family transcriptional regulator n=1 Tax=Aquihabitans sp. McL0605 TaxID=3415671 RepID=UPI003CEDBEF8